MIAIKKYGNNNSAYYGIHGKKYYKCVYNSIDIRTHFCYNSIKGLGNNPAGRRV